MNSNGLLPLLLLLPPVWPRGFYHYPCDELFLRVFFAFISKSSKYELSQVTEIMYAYLLALLVS